jgi:hypothetical protein
VVNVKRTIIIATIGKRELCKGPILFLIRWKLKPPGARLKIPDQEVEDIDV